MGQFDFQQSTSPLLAAIAQAPAQRQQMEIQAEQNRRERLNSLLNNLSQFASVARNVQQLQAGQLQQQQAESQMQGQQRLQGLFNGANTPAQPTPLAPRLGPGVEGPITQGAALPMQTMQQQPGFQSALQSALVQASPDSATSAIASQFFPKPASTLEALAARSLANGQAVDPNIAATKASLTGNKPTKFQSKDVSYNGETIKADYDPTTRTYRRAGTDEILSGDIKPVSSLSPIAEIRRQSLISQLNDKFSKKMSPTNWTPGTVAGKSAALVANADSAINLADQMLSGQVPTTEQTMTSLALDANRVLTQSGVSSEKTTAELKAKTGFASIAQGIQYFTSHPTDQKLQPFVKILKNEVSRQRDQRQAIVDRTLAGEFASLNQLRRLSPNDWEQQVTANGFDLESAKKGKLKIRPDVGSTMYGWDIGDSGKGFGATPSAGAKSSPEQEAADFLRGL